MKALLAFGTPESCCEKESKRGVVMKASAKRLSVMIVLASLVVLALVASAAASAVWGS